jgi:hypothetical protein
MSDQIQELALLLKVAQVAKATTYGPSDPDGSEDDCGLNSYLEGLVEPPDPDANSTPANMLHDSLVAGMPLAKARLGILKSDYVQTHKELSKAMHFHTRLHGQINAAARGSEFDPNDLRRKEQQED